MSRSGYVDDEDYGGQFAMWRGQVRNAIRGRRGQRLLRDMIAALDAIPEKCLVSNHLVTTDGEVCALGALGKYRGVDLTELEEGIDADGEVDDPDSLSEGLAAKFDAAHQLIREIQYLNDECFDWHYVNNVRVQYTPEERWQKMRDWAEKNLKTEGS